MIIKDRQHKTIIVLRSKVQSSKRRLVNHVYHVPIERSKLLNTENTKIVIQICNQIYDIFNTLRGSHMS